MRVALARILLMAPDALLLDEPTNHLDIESIIWLERFLRDFPGAIVMTSHDREFLNRLVTQDRRDRRRRAHHLLGQLRLLRAPARDRRHPAGGAVRPPASDAREGKGVHRALQGPRQPRRAGPVAREEAREDREGRAAAPPQGRRVRVSRRAALGRGRRQARGVVKRYGARTIYDGLDLLIRRRERWCVMGVNGAGKSTLLKLIAGRVDARRRARHARREREARLLRPARDGAARRRRRASSRRCRSAFPLRHPRLDALARRGLRLLGRRRREALPRPVGRREGAAGARDDALRSAQLPGARRADQPPGHGDQGDARQGADELRGHDALRVARPELPRRTVQPRPRARPPRARTSTAAATPSTSPAPATRRPA